MKASAEFNSQVSVVELRPGVFRPDVSMVTTQAAREALVCRCAGREGLLDKWLHALTPEEDLVWRTVVSLYGLLGRAPYASEVGASTNLPEGQVKALLLKLAERDLLALDTKGNVQLAYPFIERVTGHRVVLGDHTFNSLCAIDALGTGDMFQSDIRVRSECRFSGEAIEITTCANGKELERVTPASSVVWYDFAYLDGAASSCCPVMAFFTSDEHLQLWLGEQSPRRSGMRLSMPEALEVGRAIFAPVLRTEREN